ncbi:MAG: hypothetical protein ACTHQQ_23620 [Solirubrobacteraceae bacterium]
MDHINQVASDVAGFPVEADMEDNWDQWTWEVFAGTNGNPPPDASAVLGFTFPFATPDGYMWWRASDGVTHSILIYHHVFLSPTVYGELMRIEQQGIVSAASADLLGTAEGLLALVHEATHQKLDSGDESRVNACAVQEIPDVLTNDYGLPATVSTTSSVPQHYRVLVRRRVRVHGRWVVRKRYVTRTRYVDVTTTGPNPVFTEIVGEVAKYRSNQPAPYNTGTCW